MVRPLGFEPRTCGLRVRCSAIELEAQLFDLAPGSISLLKAPGGADGDVTPDVEQFHASGVTEGT